MAEATVIRGMLDGGWRTLAYEPFREGIEICRLDTGEGPDSAQAAVLRYAPGATVPLHDHTGAEMVIVLEGEQRDLRGSYPAGTVVINHAGSRHDVSAPDGCVVLILWSRPVAFVDHAAEALG